MLNTDENAYWSVIAIAQGKRTVQQVAAWLRQHTIQAQEAGRKHDAAENWQE